MSASSPYRGLMPYTEEDSEWFFGREDETELIGANLLSARLTLLYGTSGAGKSSVLRAGVIYRLAKELNENRDRYGQPEFAVAYFRSWCGNVTKHLIDTIRAAVATALGGRDAGGPHATVIEECRAACAKLGGRLLLILDQFEEYFVYQPLGHEFEGILAELVHTPDLAVNVLLSMREDSLARLDRFKGKIPNLFSNYLRVKHLERDAARNAIEQPALKYRALYPEQAIEVRPDLVDDVLDSITIGKVQIADSGCGSARPQKNRVEAPYLQLVMTRLWGDALARNAHSIARDDLHRLGGAERVVRSHLERVLNELTPAEQGVAAALFHYLVTPTGSKIAYSVSDLSGLTGDSCDLVQHVVATLEKNECRVLRIAEGASGSDAAPRYEIFHDVLGRAVLEWRRQYILQRDRKEEEARARESTRLRRRRIIRRATFGAIAALLPVLLAYTAYTERRARLAAQTAARASELAQRASEERTKSEDAQRKTQEALVLAQQASVALAQSLQSCKSDAAQVVGDLQQKLDRIKNQVDLARSAQANAEQYSLEAQKLGAPAPTTVNVVWNGVPPSKACFAAGTAIETPRGPVSIEILKVGDQVISTTTSGTAVVTTVRRVFVSTAPLLIVHTDRGTLRTTADHPLATSAETFTEASTLRRGSRLLRWDHGEPRWALVAGFRATTVTFPVYNLEVDDPHTFVADGFVVHNKSLPAD